MNETFDVTYITVSDEQRDSLETFIKEDGLGNAAFKVYKGYDQTEADIARILNQPGKGNANNPIKLDETLRVVQTEVTKLIVIYYWHLPDASFFDFS